MFKSIIVALILVASVSAQSSGGGGGGGGGPGPLDPMDACSAIGYDITLSKWSLVEQRFLVYEAEYYTDNFNQVVIYYEEKAQVISHDYSTAFVELYDDHFQFQTLQKSVNKQLDNAPPVIVLCAKAEEIPEFGLISGVIVGLLSVAFILKRN